MARFLSEIPCFFTGLLIMAFSVTIVIYSYRLFVMTKRFVESKMSHTALSRASKMGEIVGITLGCILLAIGVVLLSLVTWSVGCAILRH